MYDIEFTIREPKIPLLNRIIFSFMFSSFFTFLVYFLTNLATPLSSSTMLYAIICLVWLFLVLIVFFAPMVLRHYIHFNFSNSKIKHSYSLGALNYSEKWQNLENLNYISVFHTRSGYEINLWYEKNKILNLLVLEDFEESLKKGAFFSEKLNIDLLDARKRGYHKWVNTSYNKTDTQNNL